MIWSDLLYAGVALYLIITLSVLFGFWMGRRVVGDKAPLVFKPRKAGGMPLFEEDPWEKARLGIVEERQ